MKKQEKSENLSPSRGANGEMRRKHKNSLGRNSRNLNNIWTLMNNNVSILAH